MNNSLVSDAILNGLFEQWIGTWQFEREITFLNLNTALNPSIEDSIGLINSQKHADNLESIEKVTVVEEIEKIEGIETVESIESIECTERVEGQATFSLQEKHRIYYREQGLYFKNQKTYKITKDYFYQLIEKNIVKSFSQNQKPHSLFYILKFLKQDPWLSNSINTDIKAFGVHDCKADHYSATYSFFGLAFEKFILTYQVKGPFKNYHIKTVYSSERTT